MNKFAMRFICEINEKLSLYIFNFPFVKSYPVVTQVTTVLLTSLGTDWTQSHQGNNNAMLLLFSVIFQKEFLIPSYIKLLRELTVALVLTMPIGVFLSVCNHHYNELCMCCLHNSRYLE